jgi:hypothetical protein
VQRGLDAGLSAKAVDAIRNRRSPQFARDDERMVYDVVTELNEKRTLGAGTFDRALTVLKDRELVVKLIAVAGFYTMIAIILNSFEVPILAGKAGFEPGRSRPPANRSRTNDRPGMPRSRHHLATRRTNAHQSLSRDYPKKD